MGNTVLVKKMNEIDEMKRYYQSYLIDKLPPGSVFAAKTPTCAITAYKSGKVLFQGGGCEVEAAKWGKSILSESPEKKKSTTSTYLPDQFETLSVVGSDEVGTGDFFGPITVVAAYVKKEQIPLLKELGVKDSKNLKDEQIISIAKQIKDIVPHSLLTLHNEKYNKLQKSGMSQGKMKALLHNQAIGHVLGKIAPEQPDAILIDQFAKKEIYYQYLKNEKIIQRNNVFFSTKAESVHLAVAAASILARYAFVRHFENLSKVAGFTLTKGAGSKVDEAAARLIHEKGKDSLPTFVKLHFANTEKAMNIYRKKYS
ncbi:ribonuclease HIII [Cytobacillus solani]|uniref:Ribonuclease HIII n=1 Tax=Cytobacillus solani TaxID=1637975 RepID=A0A0Q3VJ94_9BACI|nr:ribonuclease HIII [Cytobacillus solani]KOP83667.1 ribonuclease HIII [Bacillus sp. FJAT-21945]KQL20743.1 ribonuclease HIII [Cytobacillus solani]USK53980.1 ribonuclease HIII [Cytobacillus solani]